ncbi:MAG: hypothetical protein P8L45_10125 [Longimicrobiales bacterium]|nr:hypothetical protein [Longimicrobiales bacterium]
MSRQGFNLIEVVVASVLLQVGLLGVLGTLVRATEVRSEADVLERAIVVAESTLDSLLAADTLEASRSLDRGGLSVVWSRSGQQLRVVVIGARGRAISLTGFVEGS